MAEPLSAKPPAPHWYVCAIADGRTRVTLDELRTAWRGWDALLERADEMASLFAIFADRGPSDG